MIGVVVFGWFLDYGSIYIRFGNSFAMLVLGKALRIPLPRG